LVSNYLVSPFKNKVEGRMSRKKAESFVRKYKKISKRKRNQKVAPRNNPRVLNE